MNLAATEEAYDSPERVKRREQKARSIGYGDVPGTGPAPLMRKPDFEALFQRLREKSIVEERPCSVCGSATTDANDPPLCLISRCEATLKARRWSALPKVDMLRHTGTPELYREDFDVDQLGGYWRGRWPTCRDPEVPDLVRGLRPGMTHDPEEWTGLVPFVTIIGPNQNGKTRLAVEMCVRAIKADQGESTAHCFGRSGADSTRVYPLYFVNHLSLVEEDRELPLGQPRAMMNYAKAARFLILDDLGQTSAGIERISNLCEARHSRRRPTVWTSHLYFSSTSEGNSIRGLSEMMYARMRQGLVVALGDK